MPTEEDFLSSNLKAKKKKSASKIRGAYCTRSEKDDIFCFEQLGVDYMFVDEAHMFKKLYDNYKVI